MTVTHRPAWGPHRLPWRSVWATPRVRVTALCGGGQGGSTVDAKISPCPHYARGGTRRGFTG